MAGTKKKSTKPGDKNAAKKKKQPGASAPVKKGTPKQPSKKEIKKIAMDPRPEEVVPKPVEPITLPELPSTPAVEEFKRHLLAENTGEDEERELTEYEKEKQKESLERGDVPMTLIDHLDEFRSRILTTVIILMVLTTACFFLSDYLVTLINKPFTDTGNKLSIFKLAGGFMFRMKVSAIMAAMVSLPVMIYLLWGFIKPAISPRERKNARWLILTAILLFYTGVAFVMLYLIPFAVPMLLQFIPKGMTNMIGADDYLSFVLLFSVSMGVLFELPVAIMIMTKMGIVTPQFLITKRKYAIVLIFIIAAIVTPQDVISMFIVAVPLMFLYEISIVISRIVYMRKRRRERELERQEEDSAR